jgi:hypothetical protein
MQTVFGGKTQSVLPLMIDAPEHSTVTGKQAKCDGSD